MPRNNQYRYIEDMDLKEAREIRKKCKYKKQRDVAAEHQISATLVHQIVHEQFFPEPNPWDTLLGQKRLGSERL